jgi:hypothetical protein
LVKARLTRHGIDGVEKGPERPAFLAGAAFHFLQHGGGTLAVHAGHHGVGQRVAHLAHALQGFRGEAVSGGGHRAVSAKAGQE